MYWQCVGNVLLLAMCGQCIVIGDVWAMYCYWQCVGNVWVMYGQCVGDVWAMYGQCVGNVWAMYGRCKDNMWAIYYGHDNLNIHTLFVI